MKTKLEKHGLFPTTTIGALIDQLKQEDGALLVQFDFCYLSPSGLDSYRGFYDHAAMGWVQGGGLWSNDTDCWPTVERVVKGLEKAIAPGKTYQGWKGGTYKFTRDTPIWVANSGHTGSTAIVGVRSNSSFVVLLTKNMDHQV